jgi:serine/threonine-protein kinase
MGRFTEAREQLDRAEESDPLSVRLIVDLATWHWFQRHYQATLAQVEKAIEMDPDNPLMQHFIGYVLLKMNRVPEAVAHVQRSIELGGSFAPEQLLELKRTYGTAGATAFFRKEAEFAEQLNDQGKYQSPLMIALAYVAAGDQKETLNWLEKAVSIHAPWLPELKVDPVYDGVRAEPRFVALVHKVGLE